MCKKGDGCACGKLRRDCTRIVLLEICCAVTKLVDTRHGEDAGESRIDERTVGSGERAGDEENDEEAAIAN